VALFTAASQEQYREAIVTALQEVERLSQVIRALLQLAQAESGQLELQRSELDLAELVRDLVDQFAIPAEESEIQLSSSIPERCPAYVDRVQIGRLLTNLLSNALKYTPSGGSVHVSLETRPNGVMLDVADTGAGIDQDHLPHIFDRFYRAPATSRHEKGLGLGLSFVAWIVQAHKGRIDVDSKPGQGTRFRIFLPAAAAPKPQPAAVIESTR
jgi:signal transduction histidine kinase